MLTHDITYEDYNGKKVTETFYFHVNESELVELNVEEKEGMYEWLQKIIQENDQKKILQEFKRIVLLAYGQKSEDGKRFIKNDQLREEFSQTAAYNQLFMDLVQDEDLASRFIMGILPKDLAEKVKNAPELNTSEEKSEESQPKMQIEAPTES